MDSSIFRVRFCDPIVLLVALLEVRALLPLRLWLKSCQGTGISLPVMLAPEALLGTPDTLERLEGAVSRPEVDVSEAPPADESERIANSMRPDWGLTVRSRICPNVFPSCDWTVLFMS